ncbi:MAG: glycoside hydrolase family 15 protein [Acidimicrobiales bacterium]
MARRGLAQCACPQAPSPRPLGSIAAAGTTSVPETIGGERNWDYRFCWVRDAAFVLGALLRLGCLEEADAFFWWLMQASQLTHPRLQVLYRLDGGARAEERPLPLAGYRGSLPVRVGNRAADQVQLDVYGDLFQAAWLYTVAGRRIDPDIGRRLEEMADLVCRIWSQPDADLWEVRSAPRHFTQSDPQDTRLRATVEAVRRDLSHGPFVHRYTGEDGLAGDEEAFLTCSFWLAEALAVQGRRAEASALMDELIGLVNDVGLYAEEIDPSTGEFLGNLPHALTHLALIHAALAFEGAVAP